MTLQSEIKQSRPFRTPEEEAFLNVVRTAAVLTGNVTELFSAHELTGTQYNVLRILRGAGGEGLPCLEIGRRMVTRVPDVTRLLDRLERDGLITRERSDEDRRVWIVKITAKGKRLVDELDEPTTQLHKQHLGHMTRSELRELIRLLEKARGSEE